MSYRNPILSPNNFTQGHLMKKEWFVINVTPVGSPDRADCTILGLILGVFWPIQATFVVGKPLYYVGTAS